jgi:aldehyde:ferredoxin oxidoreductase
MKQTPGYAGKILDVNLSTGQTQNIPTQPYADRFIGGRGIAAKIHWDDVPPEISAFDPENRLVFMTGPVCGVPGFAGSRWQVSGKSPLSNQFAYCNLGGSWGAQLKFAGFDGLIIHGKADDLVYLKIENNAVEIKSAAHLKQKGAIAAREKLKEELDQSFRIVSIGPAGENKVVFASLLADGDASGSGGLGAVMGSKNVKAIAVRGDNKVAVADHDKAGELRKQIRKIKGLPAAVPPFLPGAMQKSMCFGCINGCIRNAYTDENGQTGKSMCHAGIFYFVRALRFHKQMTEVPFHATKFCDDLGMDTYAVDMALKWLDRCHKAGIVTDEETGIPISQIGSLEFIETLTRKIAYRQGIGDLLAGGVKNAAAALGEKHASMITDYVAKTGEMQVYDPRLYLTTAIFWAMEPRLPIAQLHEISRPMILWAAKAANEEFMGLPAKDNYMTSDVVYGIAEKFWGGEIAADFSTYEGKARAAACVQNRQMLHESLILCDMSWPIMHSPATNNHVGDPLLGYRILSAVTGRHYDESALDLFAERIFTLQRAGQLRDGHNGRKDDTLEAFHFTVGLKGDFGNEKCLVPGKGGEVLSRKGMVLDRDKFEQMKDEYYLLRGWDVKTGLPGREVLERLDLQEVAEGLENMGLPA